jgi:hypothetical protein
MKSLLYLFLVFGSSVFGQDDYSIDLDDNHQIGKELYEISELAKVHGKSTAILHIESNTYKRKSKYIINHLNDSITFVIEDKYKEPFKYRNGKYSYYHDYLYPEYALNNLKIKRNIVLNGKRAQEVMRYKVKDTLLESHYIFQCDSLNDREIWVNYSITGKDTTISKTERTYSDTSNSYIHFDLINDEWKAGYSSKTIIRFESTKVGKIRTEQYARTKLNQSTGKLELINIEYTTTTYQIKDGNIVGFKKESFDANGSYDTVCEVKVKYRN